MADSRVGAAFHFVVQEVEHHSLTSHCLAATGETGLATDPGERVCDVPSVWLETAGSDDVRLADPPVPARHQQLEDRELRRRELDLIVPRPHLTARWVESQSPSDEPFGLPGRNLRTNGRFGFAPPGSTRPRCRRWALGTTTNGP